MYLRPAVIVLCLSLAGCTGGGGERVSTELLFTTWEAPPWAPPGTCWGKDVSPALVETVTEQVIIRPAVMDETGAVTSPALFETQTRQAIVREREESWFESPCAATQDPEFIATLQRALQARGFHDGQVSGVMDRTTQNAVRAYQRKVGGPDSGILSIGSAQRLGILALGREAFEE